MKRFFPALACALAVNLSAAAAAKNQMDTDTVIGMDKIRSNLKHLLVGRYSAADAAAGALLRQVQPDGSLAGMNYHQEKVRGSAWSPARHLAAMQTLAPTHPDVAARMLDFWIRTDGISENWWWPQIGIPAAICRTMLMLDRQAGSADTRLRTILDRSVMGRTGQNKVWLAGIHLMKGLLYNDHAMVEAGRDAIISEICITEKEGLQTDWSFHQHGPQLQFGNYGLSWFEDMAFWASVLAGTGYAFPPEKMALLTRYYENGLRWTLYKDMMDINACGRQIIVSWPFNKYRQVCRTAELLKSAGLLNDLPEPAGSICYPRSGYLIHRDKDFFFSVKMSSSKLIGSEVINSENAQGRYSADGATMLYTKYPWDQASIALRNWQKVPGTTELQKSDSLLPDRQYYLDNSSSYCCFADGSTSAAMMRFRVSDLQADKAWFCFGKYIVCMGNNIRTTVPDRAVTTLVQRIRQTPVLLAGVPLADGSSRSGGKCAFTFEGMKYLLPESGSFHFLLDRRQGDWNTINLEHPSTPVCGDMLTVWQEHDSSVPGQYLYVIHPEDLPSPEIEYLRGDNVIGLRTPDGIMAAFFAPGRIGGIAAEIPGLYVDFKNIRKFIPLSN